MRYDLIIVGGGMVGAGLALALQSSNLSIALIDARKPSNDDPRLFALNASSCHFLENIKLWSKLSEYASPIHQVHVTHQGHFGAVRLHREDVQLPALGYVIPAHLIEMALNEQLESLPRLTLYQPAILKNLKQENGLAFLTVETEEGEISLTSSVVIGADGAESTVRKQLNIATEIIDYEQSAIVARTTLQRPHGQIAYERFNSKGAIAMLPLRGNECATIWSADNELIHKLTSLTDDEFLHVLQKEFGYRLGRLQQISKRHVFPLRKICAEKSVDQCALLLGNAMHTLHPIAAQGFNLALYEVAMLTESIMEKVMTHSTFSAQDLQQMSEKMQKQQTLSMNLSHFLTQLFSSKSSLLANVLPFGMLGFDILTPIKKRFIEKMLGRTGRVPRLLLSTQS